MEDNKLQKDDFILPGDLGTVNVCGTDRKILATKSDNKNGSFTFTIGAAIDKEFKTEDADYEIVQLKQITDRA